MGTIYKRGDKYGIDYVNGYGMRVRKLVAKDKSVANTMLGREEHTAEKIRSGMLVADPKEARKPLEKHLDEYVADLERRGRDAMYCYTVRKHLDRMADAQGWTNLAAITVRSISGFLSAMHEEGRSAKTVNSYRADLAAFLRWCVKQRILETSVCEQVPKATVKKVKTRRALSVEEIKALLNASPSERRLAYLFLVYTGLRRGEAEQIRWRHLHLDVANPYVELDADITKSGRNEQVPLVPELVDALKAARGDDEDHHGVFGALPSMVVFRNDLKAAGIAEADAHGRKVVLHSLRHSLATMLAVTGVPMAIAQKIMRHSDIRLTAEVYTDHSLLPSSAAMKSLPRLTGA